MTHKQYTGRRAAAVLFICAGLFRGPSAAQLVNQQPAGVPETVMVTFHAKPGAETELARLIEQEWTAGREMNLFRDSPHVTLRGIEDESKTYFVEVLTWRDTSLPDAAPPSIQKIWTEMRKLVEPRGGHEGIQLVEVSPITR